MLNSKSLCQVLKNEVQNMLISFHLQKLELIRELGKGAIQEICALLATVFTHKTFFFQDSFAAACTGSLHEQKACLLYSDLYVRIIPIMAAQSVGNMLATCYNQSPHCSDDANGEGTGHDTMMTTITMTDC